MRESVPLVADQKKEKEGEEVTKLYRMKPLVWVEDGDDFVCDSRLSICLWKSQYELTLNPEDISPIEIGSFATADEAKAYAEELAPREALRWVEEVTPEVTPEAPRWIPVGERMPEPSYDNPLESDKLAVLQLGRGMVIAQYLFGDKCWCETHERYGPDELASVTHWMALPEPPKGGA